MLRSLARPLVMRGRAFFPLVVGISVIVLLLILDRSRGPQIIAKRYREPVVLRVLARNTDLQNFTIVRVKHRFSDELASLSIGNVEGLAVVAGFAVTTTGLGLTQQQKEERRRSRRRFKDCTSCFNVTCRCEVQSEIGNTGFSHQSAVELTRIGNSSDLVLIRVYDKNTIVTETKTAVSTSISPLCLLSTKSNPSAYCIQFILPRLHRDVFYGCLRVYFYALDKLMFQQDAGCFKIPSENKMRLSWKQILLDSRNDTLNSFAGMFENMKEWIGP